MREVHIAERRAPLLAIATGGVSSDGDFHMYGVSCRLAASDARWYPSIWSKQADVFAAFVSHV